MRRSAVRPLSEWLQMAAPREAPHSQIVRRLRQLPAAAVFDAADEPVLPGGGRMAALGDLGCSEASPYKEICRALLVHTEHARTLRDEKRTAYLTELFRDVFARPLAGAAEAAGKEM